MDRDYYFKIAIKTAVDLRKQLEEKNTTYRESLEDYKSGKANSWYMGTPIYAPISAVRQYNLITLSAEISEARIKLRLPKYESIIVNGYFKKYLSKDKQEKIEIVITRHNPCHTRFYICKELMHLYIYTPEAATASLGDLNSVIDSLLNISRNEEDVVEQLASEHAGYYGATELLIPTKFVPEIYAIREELQSHDEFKLTANLEIAKKLGVPESIIEFRLNDSVNKYFDQCLAD